MAKTEPLPTAEIGDFAVPRHVAIIMDGNGRWAAARGLPRGAGHRRGVEALRRTVRAASDLGIGYLTIFSFNYGARQELARAARRIAAAVTAGDLPLEAVTADRFAGYLDAPDLPDP